MWVTQQELATILGVGMRQIRQLANKYNMFMARDGNSNGARYDLAFCVHEYVKFKFDEGKGKSSDRTSNLNAEKATHEQIKQAISKNALEMSDIKLAKLKRMSFDASDVEDAWAIVLMEFKSSMVNLSQRLAPELVSNDDMDDIAKIIDTEVNDILNSLASFNLDMIQSSEDDDADDDQTAGAPVAEEDAKTVKAKRKTTSKSVGSKKPKTGQ